LVERSIAGPAWHATLCNENLPAAFLDWLAAQWAANQRDKFRPVYVAALNRLARWRAGDESAAIPGYDAPPIGSPTSVAGHPEGWEYGNLLRHVQGRCSRFARKLIQIGPKAASNLGPQLLTTRVGLVPGQYIILDDSWNDFKVVAQGQTCRLLSFHALDLASGCNLMRGYKPALKDEHEVEERLREQEMLFLLVTLFTTIGYRRAGTTLICERSTATVRQREEELFQTFGLPIKVERGPRGGGPGVAGLFTGPGGGNPRWKAPLESWFNLLRNRTASVIEFPSQTGSNSRLNMPEGLPGLEKDIHALILAAKALPPEQAQLLQLGMLPLHDAISKLDAITELINCRNDHNLEGWRAAGHCVCECRLGSMAPWFPAQRLLELQNDQAIAISQLVSADPSLKRMRPLSNREVFDAGAGAFVKMPIHVAAIILGDVPPASDAERQVKRGLIEIQNSEISPEPLVYGYTRRDGRGVDEPLRDQEKYLVRLNPLDTRWAWLYHASGAFAGVAPRYDRVRRDDPNALTRAYAVKHQALAPLLAEGRALAGEITRQATDRAAHNIGVLNAKRRKLEQFEGTSEALLDGTSPAESAYDELSTEALL
jgi:hypothetical protein